MKAMIWKEWRENLKWGALAFLALGLATIYATTQGFNSREAASPNLFEATTPLTLFLVPLFAGVLGIVQVGGELRRDQWAFLLHRPVSRSVIFAGKAVAGLAIYFAATFTPMLLLAFWMRTPGAIAAPFDWRLMLAPLANILAGVAFYFAGMLTAVRPARWYGSRALGFALAVGVLLVVSVATEFWQAVLVALLGAATLGAAAWGSFLTSGTYDRQPKGAKIALGLTLLLSTALVVGSATAFMVDSVARRQRMALYAGQSPQWQRASYIIDKTGRILISLSNERGPQNVTDLQGHRVPTPKESYDEWNRNYLLTAWQNFDNLNFRSLQRYYLPLSSDYSSQISRPQWFWVKSEGRLVGFSPRSKRRIGSLGPQGFVPAEQGVAAPFPEPLEPLSTLYNSWSASVPSQDVQILRFAHSLFFWNVNERRVSRFYTASSAQPIQGVGVVPAVGNGGQSGIALVDQNTVRVLTKSGRFLFATPVKPETNEKFSLSISATAKNDRFSLWYEPQAVKPLAHISVFSARGVPLAKHELPSLNRFNNFVSHQSFWYEQAAPVVEVPPLLMGVLAVMEQRDAQKYSSDAMITRASETRNGFLISLLLGAFYAGLAFRVARRVDLSPQARLGWAVSVFALGLFGLLLLLSLHEWPLRLPCAVCGKKRGLSRENCEHCGAPFPEPPFDETAIFDEPVTATDAADWNRVREAV